MEPNEKFTLRILPIESINEWRKKKWKNFKIIMDAVEPEFKKQSRVYLPIKEIKKILGQEDTFNDSAIHNFKKYLEYFNEQLNNGTYYSCGTAKMRGSSERAIYIEKAEQKEFELNMIPNENIDEGRKEDNGSIKIAGKKIPLDSLPNDVQDEIKEKLSDEA